MGGGADIDLWWWEEGVFTRGGVGVGLPREGVGEIQRLDILAIYKAIQRGF